MTPAYSCAAVVLQLQKKKKKRLNEVFVSLVGVIVLTKSAQPESIFSFWYAGYFRKTKTFFFF